MGNRRLVDALITVVGLQQNKYFRLIMAINGYILIRTRREDHRMIFQKKRNESNKIIRTGKHGK